MRIISCFSVAVCQCDVLILCTFIMCMRCIGFAVAVVRVTSSRAAQRKKHATRLCEHNTVVDGQSDYTVSHKVLLFCISSLKVRLVFCFPVREKKILALLTTPCPVQPSELAVVQQGVKLTIRSAVRLQKRQQNISTLHFNGSFCCLLELSPLPITFDRNGL